MLCGESVMFKSDRDNDGGGQITLSEVILNTHNIVWCDGEVIHSLGTTKH